MGEVLTVKWVHFIYIKGKRWNGNSPPNSVSWPTDTFAKNITPIVAAKTYVTLHYIKTDTEKINPRKLLLLLRKSKPNI